MRPRHTGWTRVLFVATFAMGLSACRGCAGKDEIAFCDAVERNDPAAAQALLSSGRVNVLARNASGTCQPIMLVFEAATPRSPKFTAMAVSLVKAEGIANTYWTKPSSSNRSGTGGATQRPIQLAARNGNAVLLRAVIAAGADVHSQAARSGMADAVGSGSLEIVRLLVEAGADPNSALPFAISTGRTAIVSYLEGKGAREDADPVLVAARQGDLPAIEAAVTRRPNLEVMDSNGRTALMRAAYFGHAAAVTRLAKAGASLAHTSEDMTALHLAANQNDVPVIKALASAGANLNARAGADAPTPLLTAIGNGATDAVSALVDLGADTNVALASDLSAVSKSIALGNLAMLRALLRGGARINEQRGARWQPPIHWSLGICGLPPEGGEENDNYRVTLLQTIVAAGANATAKNAEGQTPVEAVTKLLNTAEQPFYRACMQAKLDYLRSRARGPA